MNLSSNLKDTVSSIAAGVLLVCGAVLALPTQGITLPTWLVTAAGVGAALAGAAIGILTGKLPNGTTKPPEVVTAQNKEAADAPSTKG
jgi:hypothetical protein